MATSRRQRGTDRRWNKSANIYPRTGYSNWFSRQVKISLYNISDFPAKISKLYCDFRLNFMHLMDWTATIMDFGGIDPARANPDFDGMSFKDTFYNGNDISPSPRKDLFMFMNGSPAVSSNQFHEC